MQQGRAEKDRIANELEAARRNVFIQRDSPIYLLWSLHVQHSVPLIEARIVECEGRLAATKAEAQDLMSRAQANDIPSPVSGIIWNRNPTSGFIAKGESIVEVAEAPEGEIIEAQFQEIFAEYLVPKKASVAIKVSGVDKVFWGTVEAVRQSNPTEVDNTYAIRLPRRLNQLRVFIKFAPPADDNFKERFPDGIMLGRQCRVLVVRPGFHLLEGVAVQLFSFFGW